MAFSIEWFSGTGAGGQHRNKKQTSCRVIHKQTGIVKTSQGRDRNINLKLAKNMIMEELRTIEYTSANKRINNARVESIGTGFRGDKIRTYRFQNNMVIDHVSGKTAPSNKIMKGYFDLLWV